MTDLKSPVPDPVPGAEPPGISRAIYGMPMFATLLARDIRATVSWYTTGLGFIDLFTIPGPHGDPVLVHLRRWQFQDLLARPAREPAVPGSGCTLSFAAVYDEIDTLAERARAHGGGQVDGPADTPWNTRDLTTTDPDGNIVIFTAARPPELVDPAFSQQMRQWGNQQGLRPNSPVTDLESATSRRDASGPQARSRRDSRLCRATTEWPENCCLATIRVPILPVREVLAPATARKRVVRGTRCEPGTAPPSHER